MAVHPIVVVGDGIIEIPENLQHDPRFQKGARLELVPVADAEPTLDPHKPKGDWRRLRGALAHLDVRLTDEMDKERQRENDLDAALMRGNAR